MKKKNNDLLSKELDELLNQQLFKSPVSELSKKYDVPTSTIHRLIKSKINETVMDLIKRNRVRVIMSCLKEGEPLDGLNHRAGVPHFQVFTNLFKSLAGVSFRDAKRAESYGVLNPFLENKGLLEETIYSEITKWVDENFHVSNIVNKLKAHFNIDEVSLRLVWSKVDPEGSLRDYIEYRRAIEARRLFLNSGWGIQSVATRCGFKKTQTLDSVHLRQYGITFGEFIRSKSLNFGFHYQGVKIHLLPSFSTVIDSAIKDLATPKFKMNRVTTYVRFVNNNLTVNHLAESLHLNRTLLGIIINHLKGVTAQHYLKAKKLEHTTEFIKQKESSKCTKSILTEVP